MKLLITHVTRMAQGYCCVAGITEGDHAHVRPVLGRRLDTGLLRPNGGPFDMGAVVEFVPTPLVTEPPEVEDHLFDPDECAFLGYVREQRLWELLDQTAIGSLEGIFGPALERTGTSASLATGQGRASLGCYRPKRPPSLQVRDREDRRSIRVVLEDEGMEVPLTDARYYRNNYTEPDEKRLAAARDAIADGDTVVLGVGVSRPYASRIDREPRHWLQVNALHVEMLRGLRLAAIDGQV